MRLPVVLAALLGVGLAAAPAFGASVVIPVRVEAIVPQSCVIAVPPKIPLDGLGKPDLRADTLIGGCMQQPVRPLLSVRADALENGVYIATLDF